MAKQLCFSVILSSIVLLFVGCKKEAPAHDENLNSDELVRLNVDVLGMESTPEIVSKNKLGSVNSNSMILKTQPVSDGFFSQAIVGVRQHKSSNLMATSSNSTRQMEKGVRYFTLVYKYTFKGGVAGPKILAGAGLGQAGVTTSIVIQRPQPTMNNADTIRYSIISYTFNEKNTIGFPDLHHVLSFVGRTFDYQVDIPKDREFLMYRGVYNLGIAFNYYQNNQLQQPTSQNLSLTFKPLTSKFTVIFDAKSAFSRIKELAGTITARGNYYNATLGLRDSSVNKANVSYGETEHILNRFLYNATYDGTTYISQSNLDPMDKLEYSAYLLIDQIKSFDHLGLKVSVDQIKVIDYNQVSKTSRLYGDSESLVYEFKTLEFQNKYQSVGIINFFEGFKILGKYDADKQGTDKIIDKKVGVMWALSNLYYSATPVYGENYLFREQNRAFKGNAFLTSDYWLSDDMFFLQPNGSGGRGDPCLKVYPGGWRMPTRMEAEMLINNHYKENGQDISRTINVETSNARYVEYSSIDNPRKLRFYSSGYYDLITAISPNLIMTIWTSTYNSAGDPTALLISTPIGGETASADAMNYYDDDIANPKMNIRCVRDIN